MNYENLWEIIQRQKGNSFETLKTIVPMNTNNNIVIEEIKDSPSKTNIFISYSHKEAKYKDEIVTHLKATQYAGFSFGYWTDDQIEPGDQFKSIIQAKLEDANIAIFIVSSNFMASDFIQTVELPALLDSASKRGTRFLILIARKCHFKDTPLGKFQTVLPNTPDSPLNGMKDEERDAVFYNLVQSIKKIILNK